MYMHKGFCFLDSQNLLIKIYREKQGPCHILGSRYASNLKLSPVSPLNKGG